MAVDNWWRLGWQPLCTVCSAHLLSRTHTRFPSSFLVLVIFIARKHRKTHLWVDALEMMDAALIGVHFNTAYGYMDWLLIRPYLIEILVLMKHNE